jgi:hypothetical protein
MASKAECDPDEFRFYNYRLIHLSGRLFLNYQAAPVLYAIIVTAALLIGERKYKRLQVGN